MIFRLCEADGRRQTKEQFDCIRNPRARSQEVTELRRIGFSSGWIQSPSLEQLIGFVGCARHEEWHGEGNEVRNRAIRQVELDRHRRRGRRSQWIS